jgi:hypothetical protein
MIWRGELWRRVEEAVLTLGSGAIKNVADVTRGFLGNVYGVEPFLI